MVVWVAPHFGETRRRAFHLFVYNQIMERKRSLESLLNILRQQIPFLAERYGVETLEVFGSYVRDEQKQDSDLDVLITFKEDPSLLTYIAIENYLSDLLGLKVDLVMKDSLKPRIGEQILSEAIPV
jgi:predicted nucleotidyltransferase